MLWNGQTGKAIRGYSREPGAVRQITFDHAGRWLAVASDDGQVRVRPFELQGDGAPPAFRWPHERPLASECPGRLLVEDGEALAWRDLDTGKSTRLFKTREKILCGATTPDGRLVAAISGNADQAGRVRWWRDGDFTKPVAELPCGECMAAAFSPDGRQLAAVEAESGAVRLWEVAAGREIAKISLPFPMETVWVAIRWSPDGRWLGTRNGLGTWQFWDLLAHKALTFSNDTMFLGLSPDWRLALSPEGIVDIRDLRKPVPLVALPAEPNFGAFDATGSLVSFGGRDNTIRIWETRTGKLHVPVMQGEMPHYLNFTPDAKTLVTLGLGGLRYWDVDTGLPVGSNRRAPGMEFDFAMTPDNRYVVVPVGDTTEIWPLPQAHAALAEMERATWLLTGSRLGPTGDFESIPAAELRSISKK